MKKKIFAAVVAAAMVLGLAACGGGSDSKETKAPETKAAETKAAETKAAETKAAETEAPETKAAAGDGEITIGWLQKNQTNAFEIVINRGGEAVLEKAKADGVIKEYYLLDGQTDPSVQVSQANDLVNLGVDAVIIQPAELDGSAPAVDILHDAGIPVVLVNSLTSNADECEGLAQSNDVEAGEIMANYILEQCGETGKYCHAQGVIGNTAAINRTQGIHNVMDQQSGWEMLEEQSAEWQAEKASKFAQDWINLYGDELTAIVCDNDDMAVAVRLACIEAGREDIVVIGVDATEAALAMVADGELGASVRQDGTTQGATAVEMAIALAKGETLANREEIIPFELVTIDNVKNFID